MTLSRKAEKDSYEGCCLLLLLIVCCMLQYTGYEVSSGTRMLA